MTKFRAMFDGHVVAQSEATILIEGNRYFPPNSVDRDLLERSCMPSPLARRIKGYVAFWPGDVMVEEV